MNGQIALDTLKLAKKVLGLDPRGAVPESAGFIHFTELPRKVQNVLNGEMGRINGWANASVAVDSDPLRGNEWFYVVLSSSIGKYSAKELLSELQFLPFSVFMNKRSGHYVYEIH